MINLLRNILRHLPIGRIALVTAFFAYIFVVLSITLLFREPIFSAVELNPIASYRRAANAPPHLAAIEIRNVILNVIMFVPLGIFLPLLFKKLRKIYLVLPMALLVSLAIETTQFATHRGVFSVEDIIHNTLGAVLGIGLFLAFLKLNINITKRT